MSAAHMNYQKLSGGAIKYVGVAVMTKSDGGDLAAALNDVGGGN